MKRTAATQLALVNWRGVFYERYVLDAGVTALEGINGAGKTTVMVAAYVVLLPDQRYLNFAPLADAGTRSEDRGIWGRLGPGDDAYAAMEFRLAGGERLVAGVRLERTSKDGGHLHPFLVRGLSDDTPLQRLLLDRVEDEDEIPAPDRLAHLAAVAGGRLTWCDSVGTYLRELFDAGVTPMPMTTDTERRKLNELLRTSMTGGISKQLGKGLRTFLLRPEEGLGATLKRIRANLDDCRRSRMLVADARQLEKEIHDVLEAGARMFAAAIEGARRHAEERQRQADDARRKADEARAAHEALVAEQTLAAVQVVEAEKSQRKAADAAAAADEHARRAARANAIWKELLAEQANLQRYATVVEEATSVHSRADAEMRRLEQVVQRREIDYQEAMKGVGDIQSGLERWHAHASRFRVVTSALARARASLPDIEFADDDAARVLAECRDSMQNASKRLVAAEGRLSSAEEAERAFRPVHAAVERLVGDLVEDSEAHTRAMEALARLRGVAALAEQLPSLRQEKPKTEALVRRQDSARRLAAGLTTDEEGLTSAAAVRAARDNASRAAEAARDAWAAAQEHERALEREIETLQARIAELQGERDARRRVATVVQEVAARWEQTATGASEVSSLFAWLQTELSLTAVRAEALHTSIAELEQRIQAIRHSGGSFPSGLMEACEAVDGRPLVERFEDVPFEDAGEIEARLGPLAHGILVDDPNSAARTLAEEPERPDTLYLLDGPRLQLSPEHLLPGTRTGDSVATTVGADRMSVRLTRVPDAPLVGRQAREQAIVRLESEARSMEDTLVEERDRVRDLTCDAEAIARVLPKADLLERPNPEVELEGQSEALARAERSLVAARRTTGATERVHGECPKRKRALEELWGDAALLDPPDHAARLSDLKTQISLGLDAARTIEESRDNRVLLEAQLDLLRTPPPRANEIESLQRRADAAKLERDRWLAPQADLQAASADLEALAFADAEEKIHEHEGILESLNQEVVDTEKTLVSAREARDAARLAEGSASGSLRDAQSNYEVSRKRLAGLENELTATEIQDASDDALELARHDALRATDALAEANTTRRAAGERVASLQHPVNDAHEKLQVATKESQDKAAQAGPAGERWRHLRDRCRQLGVLDAALGDECLSDVEGKASVDVFRLRQEWWRVTLDRLEHTKDGSDLAAVLRHIDSSATEAGSEQFLSAWLETRAWLARRVPKHVSEVEDPVEALRKLRRYLDKLIDNLDTYEKRLRGNSNNIARTIEGRLRKVNNLLTKLNRDVRGVGFGSIEAIRVKSDREPRMADILAALSAPENQQQLFGPDITIEEALDDLFQRHGGRRDGGRKILDYREYVRLRVEIRRRGSEEWEVARGNQMSTGESIGVGAAIMMVVLTAWERDARLLRSRKESGSLRFLFLDEATRLSLDNLEVLFDLCRELDLQFLIAAPEVATSSGNTTYLLQRATDADGREVVRVSGRRAIRSDS